MSSEGVVKMFTTLLQLLLHFTTLLQHGKVIAGLNTLKLLMYMPLRFPAIIFTFLSTKHETKH